MSAHTTTTRSRRTTPGRSGSVSVASTRGRLLRSWSGRRPRTESSSGATPRSATAPSPARRRSSPPAWPRASSVLNAADAFCDLAARVRRRRAQTSVPWRGAASPWRRTRAGARAGGVERERGPASRRRDPRPAGRCGDDRVAFFQRGRPARRRRPRGVRRLLLRDPRRSRAGAAAGVGALDPLVEARGRRRRRRRLKRRPATPATTRATSRTSEVGEVGVGRARAEHASAGAGCAGFGVDHPRGDPPPEAPATETRGPEEAFLVCGTRHGAPRDRHGRTACTTRTMYLILAIVACILSLSVSLPLRGGRGAATEIPC